MPYRIEVTKIDRGESRETDTITSVYIQVVNDIDLMALIYSVNTRRDSQAA